jgi:YD repeat-containing protein
MSIFLLGPPNGRGRLIQKQVARVVLYDNACSSDVDTDIWYSADGLEMRQSVPYTATYWYSGMPGYPTPYRGQRIEPGEPDPVAYTSTFYDLLGRVVRVVAPDGTETVTSYAIVEDQGELYAEVCVTDGRDHQTCTRSDSRGRALEVDPPEGPGVAYTYDGMDRMTSAVMGSAVTSISYDFAGRKVSMDDADMGAWSYAYDGLSQLTKQTDAQEGVLPTWLMIWQAG